MLRRVFSIIGFILFLVAACLASHHVGAALPLSPHDDSESAGGSAHRSKRENDAKRRTAWFAMGRTDGNSHPAAKLNHAYAQTRRLAQIAAAGHPYLGPAPAWTSLGPISINSDAAGDGHQDYGRVSGRTLSIAIDQTDTSGNTVYVGSAGGGVWKSTNAAALDPTAIVWSALTDAQFSLVAGAIAISPANNNLILAGTGEGNSSSDSYYGQGILRSTDGGRTWTLAAQAGNGLGGTIPLQGLGFTSIAFSTDNPNIVTAASAGAVFYAANPSSAVRGLYYSTNAGQSWTLANATDNGVPVGGGTVPASATQVVYDPATHRFYAALRNHGIYESLDGANFTRMLGQPFGNLTLTNCPTLVSNSACPFYRAQMSVQPATGALYMVAVDANDVSQGIAMAAPSQLVPGMGQNTWTSVSDFDPTLPTSGGLPTVPSGITECAAGVCRKLVQGGYNLWIAALPIGGSDTNLFVGTRDIFRCDTGASANCTASGAWTNLTRVYQTCGGGTILSPFAHVHPDEHGVDFVRANPAVMYFATDGGVYRTLNGAPGDGCGSGSNPFDNLNRNLGPLAELISFAQHPTDANILLAGAQQDGSSQTNSSLGFYWQSVNGGDGGYSEIDPNAETSDGTPQGTPIAAGNVWYTANSDVSIQRCVAGTGCTSGIFGLPPNYFSANIDNSVVGGDEGAFYTSYTLEPQSTALLLVATCRLWRGPGVGGASWAGINAISPMFDYLVTGTPQPNSCSGETQIRSIAAGGASAQIAVAGQTYPIAKVVYVGMSTASSSGANTPASGHVFLTIDSSQPAPIWSDITPSGLGAVPISDIAVDPRDSTGATVYVTVMGFGYPHVLKSIDFGAHWTNLTGNLPDAPVDSIALDPNSTSTVYVGTDLGAFATTDGGATWSVFGVGLPTVPVTKMRIFNRQTLRVSTFGRGVWAAPISGTSNMPPVGFVDNATGSVGQNGVVTASGWAADNEDGAPVRKISIRLDGNELGVATLGIARPDVASATHRPDWLNSGWSASVNVGAVAPGNHTLTAVAFDSQGAQTVLSGARTVLVTGTSENSER